MTTTEEFAADIRTAPVTGGNDVDLSRPLAKHLQDLGYRKPRTITTAQELDALPEGTVIRDASGVIRDRFNDSDTGAALWLRPGAQGWMLSRNFEDKHFPATILYSPKAAK